MSDSVSGKEAAGASAVTEWEELGILTGTFNRNAYCREQLSVYYLFLRADGEIASVKKEKMDAICAALNAEDDMRRETEQNICNELFLTGGSDYSDEIIQILHRMDEEDNGKQRIKENKEAKLVTIWNLLCLAYSDGEYSLPEKKIVYFLCGQWGIGKEEINHLESSAEEMAFLCRQIAWCQGNMTAGVIGGKWSGIASAFSWKAHENEEDKELDDEDKWTIAATEEGWRIYKREKDLRRDVREIADRIRSTIEKGEKKMSSSRNTAQAAPVPNGEMVSNKESWLDPEIEKRFINPVDSFGLFGRAYGGFSICAHVMAYLAGKEGLYNSNWAKESRKAANALSVRIAGMKLYHEIAEDIDLCDYHYTKKNPEIIITRGMLEEAMRRFPEAAEEIDGSILADIMDMMDVDGGIRREKEQEAC